MADPEPFEFGEDLPLARLPHMVYATAAACGHQPQSLGVGLEHARHEIAALGFEVPQHPDLVLEPFAGAMAAIRFMDPPIESDPDGRTSRVFDILHLDEAVGADGSEGKGENGTARTAE